LKHKLQHILLERTLKRLITISFQNEKLMTLASRLDTTCYILFGYSYRKISEAKSVRRKRVLASQHQLRSPPK